MVVKKKGKIVDSCDCGDACTCGTSYRCSAHGGIYGLGFIGAVIYYISTAATFWMGALGILKAMVWPAFLIFEVLKFLGA